MPTLTSTPHPSSRLAVGSKANRICRKLLSAEGAIASGVLRVGREQGLVPCTPIICEPSAALKIKSTLSHLPELVASAFRETAAYCVLQVDAHWRLHLAKVSLPAGETYGIFAVVGPETRDDRYLKNSLCAAIHEVTSTGSFKREVQPADQDSPSPPVKDDTTTASFGRTQTANDNIRDFPDFDPVAYLLDQVASARQPWLELAKFLRTKFNAEWVFLGAPNFARRGHRLKGIAGPVGVKLNSPIGQQAHDLLSEIAIHSEPFCMGLIPNAPVSSAQSLLQLTQTRFVYAHPILSADRKTIGSLVVLFSNAFPEETHLIDASTDAKLRQAFQFATQIQFSAWTHRLAKFAFWRGMSKTKRWLWAFIFIFGLVAVPLPAPLYCKCRLEPVQMRYIPAPYDGMIHEVLVQPGTVVGEGQVLARMDRREIDLQVSAKDAEAKQASKDHDVSLANRDTSSAQVAQLEVQRLTVERELLASQAANLEIRSPISGVVLMGDPRMLTGARVPRGQVLFETAPLDRLHVELEVKPQDLHRAKVGQSVSVRLDAVPFRTFRGSVLSIAPRAVTRSNSHVFIARVEVINEEHTLRPGMQGRGKINARWRPIALSWFERLADSVYGFLVS